MKLLICVCLFISTLAHASPLDQFLTVKERLRLHLWTEGLELSKKQVSPKALRKPLPEELEKPLRNL